LFGLAGRACGDIAAGGRAAGARRAQFGGGRAHCAQTACAPPGRVRPHATPSRRAEGRATARGNRPSGRPVNVEPSDWAAGGRGPAELHFIRPFGRALGAPNAQNMAMVDASQPAGQPVS